MNVEEAKLCLALAKYLLQQDYNSKEITILSAYTGQMLFMKEVDTLFYITFDIFILIILMFQERKKDNLLSSIHITVLDNYQGEENEIIILSLVRNNHEKNVGFLSISNRICVALSRAKKGLTTYPHSITKYNIFNYTFCRIIHIWKYGTSKRE